MATFCPELPAALHPSAIHLPYCQEPVQPPPLRLDRSVSVLFIGSAGRLYWKHDKVKNIWSSTAQRKEWLQAINRTAHSHTLLLTSRDGREFHGSNASRRMRGRYGEGSGSHRALLSDANYTMCPQGDAPDTQRIYTALAHGSIPLLHDTFQPPPLVPWDEFSAPLRLNRRKDLVLPSAAMTESLLRNVSRHARSFECEPTNRWFVRYVASELARIAAVPEGVNLTAVEDAAAKVEPEQEGCRRLLVEQWRGDGTPHGAWPTVFDGKRNTSGLVKGFGCYFNSSIPGCCSCCHPD